ncbi:MAG: monovalent cation/H(+) antiporter subunit G [Saprospirales bacterium]|nr:MAG: monovalent cation/H(+) antiporter subunit G [Saprospirales bacterium]
MSDFIIALLSTLGTLFILLAALGMLRMPDFYLRVSVATKGGSLGVGLILIAAAIYFSDFGMTTRALAILFFILITAPVSAHLLGRVAYLSKIELWEKTSRDDLRGRYEREKLELKGKKREDEEDEEENSENGQS